MHNQIKVVGLHGFEITVNTAADSMHIVYETKLMSSLAV